MLDVLKYWRNKGIAGHRILAFVQVNQKNPTQVTQAINLFGGLYAGFALPKSCRAQIGKIWDVDVSPNGDPGSWGGHAVYMPTYSPTRLVCVTWAQLQQMTQAFFREYADECYGIVTQDWIAKNKLSPSGFDVNALLADLNALGQ